MIDAQRYGLGTVDLLHKAQARGLSQDELARRAGVSQSTISRLLSDGLAENSSEALETRVKNWVWIWLGPVEFGGELFFTRGSV